MRMNIAFPLDFSHAPNRITSGHSQKTVSMFQFTKQARFDNVTVFYSRNSIFVNENHFASVPASVSQMVGIQMEDERAGSDGRLSPCVRDAADRLRKLSTRLFQALSHRSWRGAIVESTNVGHRQCSNCIPIF